MKLHLILPCIFFSLSLSAQVNHISEDTLRHNESKTESQNNKELSASELL